MKCQKIVIRVMEKIINKKKFFYLFFIFFLYYYIIKYVDITTELISISINLKYI